MFRPTFVILLMLGLLLNSDPVTAQPPARFSADELDLLFRPVALYPDQLLAQMFPGVSYPAQLQCAAMWTKNSGGDPEEQRWEPCVKPLAHFPELLARLTQDMAWTEAMGEASVDQMEEVAASIQRLRSQADSAGNLRDDEHQKVIRENGFRTIQPVSPDELAVPVYDACRVYEVGRADPSTSLITYGESHSSGAWMVFGLDWVSGRCFRYPEGSPSGNLESQTIQSIHDRYNASNVNSWKFSGRRNFGSYNQCYLPGQPWKRMPGDEANHNGLQAPRALPKQGQAQGQSGTNFNQVLRGFRRRR